MNEHEETIAVGYEHPVPMPFQPALLAPRSEVRMQSAEQIIAEHILGESTIIRQLRTQIAKVAHLDIPVLIQGPTGSGKELVAQALHAVSGRAGALVAFSVAAVPEAMFEDALFGHVKGAFTGALRDASGYLVEANGGTVFLDEIGTLSPALQPKLLRVLETRVFRPVGAQRDRRSDFRVVSATNESMAALVASGTFRADLAERLSTFVVDVPPLAARPEDIPALVEHFVRHSAASPAGRAPAIGVAGLRLLQRYDWPTNVRQLRNVVERALVEAGPGIRRLGADVVRAALHTAGSGELAQEESGGDRDRAELVAVLESCDWKVDDAARSLGVNRTTVYRWMRRLRVRRPVMRVRLGE